MYKNITLTFYYFIYLILIDYLKIRKLNNNKLNNFSIKNRKFNLFQNDVRIRKGLLRFLLGKNTLEIGLIIRKEGKGIY